MNLHVAIDFTASNGEPHLPHSLHYMHPQGIPNEYESVIQSVGAILRDYDSDKKIPVFGFGGCPNPQGPVSHCFPLNGNPHDAEVDDVGGVLAAYRSAIRTARLSGPTLFGPLLQQVISTVRSESPGQFLSYHILLILTDGVIHDMPAAIDNLVLASGLPISVIIVGVGQADFAQMEVLDADDEPLRSTLTGETQKHDNVQFVPFRDMEKSAGRLSREVLRELPGQISHYFHEIQKVAPGPTQAWQDTVRRNSTNTQNLAQASTALHGLNANFNSRPTAPPQFN